MEFKPGINFRITGTIKRMEVLERGNCLVTISTSAEGQMRDVRIRFFEVAKVLLYRVRDRIQVNAHMQIRRSMRCPISCLGRFKSIADQLKEGDRIAATVYVSVREADENHPFSQNLVCTDLYKFKEEEPEPAVEAAHATKEPEE